MWCVVIFEPLLEGEGCEGDQLAAQVHAVIPFPSEQAAETWLELWVHQHRLDNAPAKAKFTYLVTPMEWPEECLRKIKGVG